MSDKIAALSAKLGALPGAVVAFSGGVDSSMLLHACIQALGRERVLALTARSPSLPTAELDGAVRVADELGARHRLIDTDELAREGYRENASDRCYFCKTELFEVTARLLRGAAESDWPLLYGAIADDLREHRPGAVAARDHGVRAPLAELGFEKADVRSYCRAHGISTAEKPSFACLSSRVPYGTAIDARLLAQLERSEAALRRLGFRQFRVRHHDSVARVEVPPDEMQNALDSREDIDRELRAAGYAYVALDLRGYRSGAMNEVLA